MRRALIATAALAVLMLAGCAGRPQLAPHIPEPSHERIERVCAAVGRLRQSSLGIRLDRFGPLSNTGFLWSMAQYACPHGYPRKRLKPGLDRWWVVAVVSALAGYFPPAAPQIADAI